MRAFADEGLIYRLRYHSPLRTAESVA